MESEQPTVVVTGVTGFLGSWLTYELLKDGRFKVRATMRNKEDSLKVDLLRQGFGKLFDDLELVSADLSEDKSIDACIQGCTYVFHVATPFPVTSPKNDDELIKPAVDGAESIVKACDKHGVKRLIFTSTIGTMDDWSKRDETIDETSIAPVTKTMIPYVKSKIYAERKIQDCVKEINKNRNAAKKDELDLVIINSSYIQGPLIVKCSGPSQQMISGIMTGKLKRIPPYHVKGIDVRDLAQCHIKGLEIEPGKRYATVAGEAFFKEMAGWIKKKYKKYGYRVTTKEASN